MATSVKLGVDIGGFTSGIREGQQVLKGLKAEMNAAESAFKATGNSEQKLQSQTKTLNSTLQVQKGIADKAKQALQAMKDAGVDPANTAYQKMYVTLMNAEAGANDAQAALNNLGQGAADAAKGADSLTKGLNGISKKISLDQVIGGIDKITSGLENAARKAVDLGEKLWNTIMDSAKRADDNATIAEMYGIDLDQYMRMQRLVAGGMDTTVESMLQSQDRLTKNIGKGTKEATEALQELGITTKRYAMVEGHNSGPQLVLRDATELFWEAGQAILGMGDAFDKEAAAQALFGRGWKELVPLFNTYKSLEEYNAALAEQTVTSADGVRDLAALNDAVSNLEASWTTLKDEMLQGVAPALTKGAEAISGLLDKLTQYLQTDDGQKMLKELGTAVSDMLSGLSEISAEDIVSNFSSLFSSLTKGLDWINQNGETVTGIIEGLGIAFAGLTISGGVLEFFKIVSGAKGLLGAGAAGAAEAGAATGASWGGAFASAVMKAAPWLVGLYTLLNPADTGNNDIIDENGNPTDEGKKYNYKVDENGELYQDRRQVVEEAAQKAWDLYRTNQMTKEAMQELSAAVLNDKAFLELTKRMYEESGKEGGMNQEDLDLSEWIKQFGEPEIPVKPKAEDGAAGELAEQIGTVAVKVIPVLAGGLTGGGGGINVLMKHANGLPFVPYDGYLAMLHRGERVLTASANRNYTYNSNNYFGNVNLNNGLEIDALCDSIDRRNRMNMRGFGE